MSETPKNVSEIAKQRQKSTTDVFLKLNMAETNGEEMVNAINNLTRALQYPINDDQKKLILQKLEAVNCNTELFGNADGNLNQITNAISNLSGADLLQ